MENCTTNELFYDYMESASFKKSEKIHELREEMSDYPTTLSVIDLSYYAPYELTDLIGEAIEDGSLTSTFSNGEEMVEKKDFILWCAEKMTRSCAQPAY
jgi:hypothetical protein